MTDPAYTIDEFCRLARFSRQYLYWLWGRGLGPKRTTQPVGQRHKVLIPAETADDWLARRWLCKARADLHRNTSNKETSHVE
ncbi:hypothetical protein HQ945_21770 [Phyllobacterium sp. BT25]|uniref:Helix-turn-helix domain-containing protein n=1 Tax=Phyllobacterium pellucidum TaxID=2740464 RepID=A0A849VV98_9HYPH|nr:hypothetical protein [Phyllobacterium pellucidum]NTS33892.1 hypothetical protein [Phyllobacterium pellucidum]